MSSSLRERLSASAYQQYVYGYPHKTAYRQFATPRPLDEVWANERRDSRFLYVHVPFCELRCGFCNLFTTVNPVESVVEAFLAKLEVEARATKPALGAVRWTRAAIGGGTPTFLSAQQLARVLEVMQSLGAPLGAMPLSVELSPTTVDREKLEVLSVATRLSLGVQSFVEAEVAALKRPQRTDDVARTLDLVRSSSSAQLNVDLIYGMEGQTPGSLVGSLETALKWRPEELYLYPLYVRPLTFLGKRAGAFDDHRRALYRVAREWLEGHGYEQRSMRVFLRRGASPSAVPEYHPEDDGMVGLGVGARSYTRSLHYAHDWAVGPRAVRGIIDEYLARPARSFGFAHHGFELTAEEQHRRWVLLSLFDGGVDAQAFERRFSVGLRAAAPWLEALEVEGLAGWTNDVLHLTDEGLELSDAIGPWLFSDDVAAKMRAWEAR
ncbi:MAG: STM4012 family radical SAM protein [Myxococcaceae bacterium]|nr:STM4012 family radical SAM protein [Myxococcaceae bacterium]